VHQFVHKYAKRAKNEFRPMQYVTAGTADNQQTKTTTVQQNLMSVYNTELYPNPLSSSGSAHS